MIRAGHCSGIPTCPMNSILHPLSKELLVNTVSILSSRQQGSLKLLSGIRFTFNWKQNPGQPDPYRRICSSIPVFFVYSPRWVFLQPEENERSLTGTGLCRYRKSIIFSAKNFHAFWRCESGATAVGCWSKKFVTEYKIYCLFVLQFFANCFSK